jgi:hypothetical protein
MQDADLPGWVAAPVRLVTFVVVLPFAVAGHVRQEAGGLVVQPAGLLWDRLVDDSVHAVGRAVGPGVRSVRRHTAVTVFRGAAFSVALVALVAATTWRYSGGPVLEALGWTWFRVVAPVGRTEWVVSRAWRRAVTAVRAHLPGRRRGQ